MLGEATRGGGIELGAWLGFAASDPTEGITEGIGGVRRDVLGFLTSDGLEIEVEGG